MSMDDFGWHFGDDWTRARRLKDAYNQLQSSHAATSSRLQSRLSKLEGSLERRLNALTSAFDAYVELGDVREELRRLPDWGATRLAVQETLELLAQDERTPLIDTTTHDHWQAHAMNAVLTLAEGGETGRHEQSARNLSDEAPVFIALVSVTIGAGQRLNGRLAALFDTVSELDDVRWLLLRAAAAGLAGEAELVQLGQRLSPQLGDVQRWQTWLRVSPTEPDGWTQVQELLDGTFGTAAPEPWDESSLADELQDKLSALASAGSQREAELLRQARDLRQRIEDPDGAREAEPFSKDVISAVQEMLVHPGVPLSAREIILSWIREPLLDILRGWSETYVPEPLETTYRARFTPPGTPSTSYTIAVTRDGGDTERVRSARRAIETAEPEGPKSSLYFGLAAVAGVIGVLTLLMGGGWSVIGVIALIAAGVLAYRGIETTRRHAAFRTEQTEAVQRMSTGINEQRTSIIAQEREREASLQAMRESVGDLIIRLQAIEPGRMSRTAPRPPEPVQEPTEG